MNKIDYKGLTEYLFWSELKSDLNKYMLGPAWWVLEPCLYVAVFYFAFAHLRGEGEHVFSLLCGISTWQWLSGVVNQGANSVSRKKGVLQNFNVHPAVFPVVTALVSLFKFIIVLVCVMIILAVNKVFNPSGVLDITLWLFTAVLISFSYAICLSLIVPFAPDIQILVSRAMMLLMFLSGVIFPINQMSDSAQQWLYLNPMTHIIEGARKVLLYGEQLDYSLWGWLLLAHTPLIFVTFHLLGRLRGEIPKRLI